MNNKDRNEIKIRFNNLTGYQLLADYSINPLFAEKKVHKQNKNKQNKNKQKTKIHKKFINAKNLFRP